MRDTLAGFILREDDDVVRADADGALGEPNRLARAVREPNRDRPVGAVHRQNDAFDLVQSIGGQPLDLT